MLKHHARNSYFPYYLVSYYSYVVQHNNIYIPNER